MLSNEVDERTRELRQLNGEELHGLGVEELKKLEKSLEGGLGRVLKTKDERFEREITALERKETRLTEENLWLKQRPQIVNTSSQTQEQGQSSESITNNGSSAVPPQDYSSDTSLKLGLPFPD
ncbi:MADS-box transcription factor [Actinidia chinensis var. chinensis]|uniref:MADS-box transcription factor n=1 Tax=Actinidia chinensis var. chinensis TaxID=1590841 RepID=A0A2R6Q642_ACTCC|nr:MADS-box transcription factor [Actinidia chinensis var. chinensis]